MTSSEEIKLLNAIHGFLYDCSYLTQHVVINKRHGKLTRYENQFLKGYQLQEYFRDGSCFRGVLLAVYTVYRGELMKRILYKALEDINVDEWNSVVYTFADIIEDRTIKPVRGERKYLFESYVDYITEMMTPHEKVAVVRLDLKYKRGIKVGIERIKSDFKRWKRAIYRCEKYRSRYICDIWRLEQGSIEGRWHMHLLLCYHSDLAEVEGLVELWEKVTDGEGLASITYDRGEASYRKGGYSSTGIVSLGDRATVIGLGYILMYFFKEDENTRGGDSRGVRMYGRGQLSDEEDD